MVVGVTFAGPNATQKTQKKRIFEGCFKSVIQCGDRARTLSGSVVIFGYANKPNQ